jgi:hypothetical protein
MVLVKFCVLELDRCVVVGVTRAGSTIGLV